MEYELIDKMVGYCMTKIRDLSDTDKVEVLKTLCCELRDKIGVLEFQLDNEEGDV